ncbi:MAG: NAD(P)H-dependent oxidoreductase [Propionibacteriaceae bacterium]|nr:NAD(P)H-dependent oxidoreductase [Propionibacteriaceae bacterium]
MRIGVIEGATRPGSNTAQVAQWVAQHQPEGMELVHLKLLDHQLPLFNWEKHPMAAGRQYPTREVQAWADAMNECDGFIFVFPEYNRGVPGGLKNAIDWLGPELWGKPSAAIGVGADGGVRGVEQLRLVLTNFNQHVVRAQVSISLFTDLADGVLKVSPQKETDLEGVFGQLREAVARAKG